MFTDSFTVRMNFSHGSYEYHQSVIDNTRAAVAGTFSFFHDLSWQTKQHLYPILADPTGRPVAIALDTVRRLRVAFGLLN